MIKQSLQATLFVAAWCAVSGPATAGVRVADNHYKLATVVEANGDVYLATEGRSVISLKYMSNR